jgi:hypothetical protein
MTRKAGQHGKADLAERKRLKAEAAAHDRFREDMESKIAQGRAKLIEWDYAIVRILAGEKLPDDCLVAAPFPPADQFVLDKLHSVPAKKFDGAMLAALLDLLMSDVPLDRAGVQLVARSIAELMKRTPKEQRLGEDRAFIDAVAMMKERLAGRGLTMAEAEEEIATTFGWKNRATLVRMLRKAKTRLRRGAAK